jgi:antitoxin component of MazEF toxin-antitoxin module
MTLKPVARFKFITKISKMGNGKIIWIPKEYHDEIETKFSNKQVRVSIDDEI